MKTAWIGFFNLLQMNKLTRDEKVFLTRKETAKILRISLPTLNEITKSGVLPGYRLRGRVLYKVSEIDSALSPIKTRL